MKSHNTKHTKRALEKQIQTLHSALAPFAALFNGNLDEVGGGTLVRPSIKIQMIKDAKNAIMETRVE